MYYISILVINCIIADKYKTYAEVQDALRAAGLESSNLIIGMLSLSPLLSSPLPLFPPFTSTTSCPPLLPS